MATKSLKTPAERRGMVLIIDNVEKRRL